MNNGLSAFRLGLLAILAMGVTLAISCSQPAPLTPPQPSEVGRFQIVLASESEHGSVLLLLDTKEGTAWIYRPPQGVLGNGFWSDIPRVTYGGDYWQRAFSQMAQQPAPPSSTTSTITNARPASGTNR